MNSARPAVHKLAALAGQSHHGGHVFVDVLGKPTETLVWKAAGSAFTAREVLVMVPGNPGVVEFYREFLDHVHADHASAHGGGLDIYAVQHLGHSAHAHLTSRAWSLSDQVAHKMHFIDSIVRAYPAGTRVHLAGHSVGAYIVLQVLKIRGDRLRATASLGRVLMLFPTVMEIADTPNGAWMQYAVQWAPRTAVAYLASALQWLPAPVLHRVIAACSDVPGEFLRTTADALIHPTVVDNTLRMADQEMHAIRDLDVATVDKFVDHTHWVFGSDDKWAPRRMHDAIRDWWPQADVTMTDHAHAFVLRESRAVADYVQQWLSSTSAKAVPEASRADSALGTV
ncbi:hypothetical protein H9P43_005664 [Blastocladiella emersonii ATCC 22665]|nr:hypothetical protein H9P43_005664 [Blastocladiella emersonii ATCC 22665]